MLRRLLLGTLLLASIGVGFVGGLYLIDAGRSRFTAVQVYKTGAGELDPELRLLRGWSQPEAWGVWSDGEQAELGVPVPSLAATDVEVSLVGRVFLVKGRRDKQALQIAANGEPVGHWTLADNQRLKLSFVVPQEIVARRQLIHVVIKIDRPQSPAELKAGTDARRIAIGLEQVSIRY